MDLKTSNKRKREAITPAPDLLEDVIIEILLRLPVKSLLRFTAVCKTWRTIISDPFFIHQQLQYSSCSKKEQDPTFLITPHTLDRIIPWVIRPTNFSNHLRFYQWQQQGGSKQGTFLYGKDLGHEFGIVCNFAHCDGLVLAPTDNKLYLFNPATRESFTLPNSSHDDNKQGGRYHSTAGLGRDSTTGDYKVVRSFYRLFDYDSKNYSMGMEVFTVGMSSGGACWREILPDPPFSVHRWQTAVTVKGSFLFWYIDKVHGEQRGVLQLCLENEEFSVVRLPTTLDPAIGSAYILDELHGELALTARTSESVTIWVMPMEEDAQWERRYAVHVSAIFRPMSLLSDGGIVLWSGCKLYRYDLSTSELSILCHMDAIRYQGRRARKWKNLSRFNVIKTYTQSLVRPVAPVLD